MKSLLLAAFCCVALSALPTYGATDIAFPTVPAHHVNTTHVVPATARIVQPPAHIVEELRSNASARITLPSPMGTWVLEGSTYTVLTSTARVAAVTQDGEIDVDAPPHIFFSGTVQGASSSRVFLAVFNTHVTGVIEIDQPDGLRRFVVAPDRVVDGRMAPAIVYEVPLVDEGSESSRTCKAEDLPDYQRRVDSLMATVMSYGVDKNEGGPQSSTVHELYLALECDSTFFTRQESNLTRAAQYALTLAGACGAVYRRDANVAIRVPFLRIWTQKDPYVGTIGERLNNIRTYWTSKMSFVRRSVTCMLSGSGGGGLAWVGVLCGDYGYNVSGVDGGVNFPASGYIWDIDVTSHELGHNIGSSHSHNCSWNPPIDSCWYAEGGCYDYVLPQRGNIMSYCHLQYTGNALSFHPRVASLFNRVMESSPCITPEQPTRDADVAVRTILIPEAGATMPVNSRFSPTVVVVNAGREAVADVVVGLRLTNLQNDTLLEERQTLSLGIGQIDTVTFSSLRLDQPGTYLTEASAVLAGEPFSTNNAMTRPFSVGDVAASSVKVVWPNGGETLTVGDTVVVRYTASGAAATDQIMVQYSTDDGVRWANVRRAAKVDSIGVSWVVPSTPSISCRVRVLRFSEARVTDMSDEPFRITLPRDIQAVDILAPEPNTTVATPMVPQVVIRNNGTEDLLNVQLRLEMTWVRNNKPSYAFDTTLANVPAGATDTVVLASTPILASGVQVASLSVRASGDLNTDNDRFARQFTAQGLTPPLALRLEPGPHRVIVSWPAVSQTSADAVEIWRADGDGTLKLLRSVNATVDHWLDTAVRDGNTYEYALRTVFQDQQSVFTDRKGVIPATSPYGYDLGQSVAIGPRPGSQQVPLPVRLVWSSVANAHRYVIQLARDPEFADIGYVLVTEEDGSLTAPVGADQTWWWRVRAINEGYTGPWSVAASFSTTANCAGRALQVHGRDGRVVNTSFTWSGGPVTVEWWQYVHADSVRNSSVFAVGRSDNTGNRFQAHSPWGNGNIYWDYGSTGGTGRLETRYRGVGRWMHVALVSDGKTRMAIYQDGELTAQREGAMEPSNLQEISIGSQHRSNYFAGLIDEFRIWTVARTQDQIRNTMTMTEPPANDRVGLYAMWRMNEADGATLADGAGRGYTLIREGATSSVPSDAGVNCTSTTRLNAAAISGSGALAPSVHTYALSWSPVAGAEWYEVEVYPADSLAGAWIHRQTNIVSSSTTVVGLPAASTCAWRVRAWSSSGVGPWAASTLRTPEPCERKVVAFTGDNDFLVSDSLLYRGKATTVEYWAFVAPGDVGNRSSFNIGTRDETTNRFQAHVPWGDRKVYFDFGNTRQGGRVESAFDKGIDGWHHVALTSDGVDEMKVYVDGELLIRSSFASAPTEMRTATIGGNRVGRNLFRGRMSEFRIWNEGRTQEQIREGMYRRLAGGQSHLLAAWPLDDAKGLAADDLGGRMWDAAGTKAPQWVADSVQRMMHVPPALRGPLTVTQGDTVEYMLHGGPYADVAYRVTNGILISPTAPQAARIVWITSAPGRICITRTYEGGCVDSACYDVRIQQPVSVEERVEDAAHIAVHPNPSADQVTITWKDEVYDVALVDLVGRVVARAQPASGDRTVVFTTSTLPTGTYLVRLGTTSGAITKPLTIQR